MSNIQDGSSRRPSFFGNAQTRLGWWSCALANTFLVLFVLWLFYGLVLRRIPRPTVFSDPLQAVLLLSAAAAAIGGGIVGTIALAVKRERSLTVLLSVLLGAFVLYWTIAVSISTTPM